MLTALFALTVGLSSCGVQGPPASKRHPDHVRQSLASLVEALDELDPATRHGASWRLRAAGAEAVELLLSRAERGDTSRSMRVTIVRTLGSIGPDAKAATPLLRAYCDRSDPDLRRASALAMGQVDASAADLALTILIDLLGEGGAIAADTAFDLGSVGPRATRAVPALVKLLKEGQQPARLAAAYALGRIGPAAEEAVPALRDALSDGDRGVAQNAREALRSIQGPRQ